MNIFLTGGAGYIGSHVLLCCLQAGHEVIVLDDFSSGSAKAIAQVEEMTGRKVTLHRGDVRDGDLLRRIFQEAEIEAVMHFAGLKTVGESIVQPLRYYDVNVGGSVALAQAMADQGVFRFVFSSTAAVYGGQAEMPVTEDCSVRLPTTPYGRSKLIVEGVLADLCAADRRWSAAVLRYFNPVGAHASGRIGEDPRGEPTNLVPYVTQVAIRRRAELLVYGNDYMTPDGTGMRDYIHVMDLAEGHLAALERLSRGNGLHTWNLGTGRAHSVLDVVETFKRVTNQAVPYRFAPRRPGDLAQCWADPTQAHRELGWTANRGLDEMLADHWRWQINNPRGYGD